MNTATVKGPARRIVKPQPFGISVTLSKDEIDLLWELARKRQEPKNGSPLARDKRVSGIDNVTMHFYGLSGEYAVAKLLNIDFDREAYLAGDQMKDLELYGVRMEVKTNQGYLVLNSMNDFKAHVLILVQRERNYPDVPTLHLPGWIDRESFGVACFEDDFGYGKKLCVQPADLHPMSTLKTYCLIQSRLLQGDSVNFHRFPVCASLPEA